MRQVPATLMRGGSSRGLLILEADLAGIPEAERLSAFAFAVGSPDPDARQVNGVGGGNATTSKVAVVAPSALPGHDVDYRFYQVIVADGRSETRGTCGNLVAAVGQFAIEKGLVAAQAPVTRVTVHDINTGATIAVEVPVQDGRLVHDGPQVVAGVPGSGAPIPVRFLEPAGRVTGSLLPSGNLADRVVIAGTELTVTFIDSVNPVALIHADSLPAATPWSLAGIEGDRALLDLLEAVRRHAVIRFGLGQDPARAHLDSPFLPFVGIYTDPLMRADTGAFRPDPTASATVRLMSGGQPHRAVPLSAGLATATLARLRQVKAGQSRQAAGGIVLIRLEHASGIIEVEVELGPASGADLPALRSVGVVQTARPIMTGTVYFPNS